MLIITKVGQQSPDLIESGVTDPYLGRQIRTTISIRKQLQEMIKSGMIPKYKDKHLDKYDLAKAVAEIYSLSSPRAGEKEDHGGDVHYFPSNKTNI